MWLKNSYFIMVNFISYLLWCIIQKLNGALLETTNETQRVPKNVNSFHQKETHSGCLSAMSDETPRMSLKVEICETPRSHQSY
jgi:hypothetical protein